MATKAAKASEEATALAEKMLSEMVDDPMAVVRDLMAGAGMEDSETWFNVYEVTDGGKGVDAFLFKCLPSDFDMEKIGREYGSGLYRLRVYVKDADYPNGVLRSAPKFAIKMPPGYNPLPASHSPATGNPVDLQAIITAAVSAASQATVAAMSPVLAALSERNKVDPMAQFQQMAGLVKTLLPPPVVPVTPPAPPTFMEELTKFKLLKEMIGGEGGGDGDGIGSTLLKEGIGMVREMAVTAQAQRPAMGTALPPPLPNPAQPVGSAPVVGEGADLTETGDEEMKLLWKMALRRACKSAAAGEKPEDFDDEWGAMVPEEVLDDLEENPEWFAEICKINPDCQLHEQWFTDLRVLLLGEPVTPVDNSLESVQAAASTNSDAETLHGDSGTVLPAPAGPQSGT